MATAARAALGLLGALAALGVLALPGCKRDPEPPEDRTLERLREAVDRDQKGQGHGRAPSEAEDPNARLAALATGAGSPVQLPLPAHNPTVHLGTLALKPTALTAANSVRVGRMGLTSEDPFLSVTLLAQNVGTAPVTVDLSLAEVRREDGTRFTVATDAQRAGTWPLEQTFEPDERRELTLYFELPASALGRGLTLWLPAGAGPDATEEVGMPLDEGR